MAVPDLAADRERPTLQIVYDTAAPIGAAEFGAVIQELGKGFDRFTRARRQRGLRLVVIGAGLGSHWIEVAVVGATSAAGIAITYRKEIYDFADSLGKVFDMAKTLRRAEAKPADRKLIDAINAPVASGQATQVNVMVLGGSPTITINQHNAQALWVPEDRADLEDALADPVLAIGNRQGSTAPMVRKLDGHFGTILNVKGAWYVRLEGQEGVLNPVLLAHGVTVEDDRAYLFDGHWEGRRYVIRKAEPIGS